MEQVLQFLDEISIKYKIIHHPPAYTTAQADQFVANMKGVFSKCLFLSNKKNNHFYLIVLDENTRLNFKTLNSIVGERLQFAKEQFLKEKMQLKPGMVSIFGLLNNKEKDIQVYIDKKVLNDKKINFDPNDNTATIFISIKDMFKYLNNLKIHYENIDL